MSLFIQNQTDILNNALNIITNTTSITSTSPGSVARAFTEAISTQLGNFYSILDFNLQQASLSTASGRSLDLIGSMFGINRKNVTDLVTIDRAIGAFYFYIDTPYSQVISIPPGTKIYTDSTTYVGQQFSYVTTDTTNIPVGRTKAYASIIPQFGNASFTAGANTLVVMDPNFVQPTGTIVKCTNPKPIQAQVGMEDDDSYRFRIQNQVRTASGGTILSIRLVGLNTPGVRDITIRDVPYGLGSFEALVVAENNLLNGAVLDNVTVAMNAVKPPGVRMYVRQPNLMPVSVSCTIVIQQDPTLDQSSVVNGVENSILRFLNTPLVGTTLVYNQLIQTILDSNNAILDTTITDLSVNGTQVLFKNYVPADNEQLIPGAITVSVAS